jgi:hypothetical protein
MQLSTYYQGWLELDAALLGMVMGELAPQEATSTVLEGTIHTHGSLLFALAVYTHGPP